MNNKLKGGVVVFLGACSFGLLSTIVKTAYSNGYSLGDITGSQAFFGMLILWTLYLFQTRILARRQPKTESKEKTIATTKTAAWKIMGAGVFTGLVSVFYYKCVGLIPASIAIILLMQYLWMSIVLDFIIFRKKPARIQLLSASVVLVGTVFAGGIFNASVTLNWEGIAYGMLAALCYSLFVLTSGRVGNDYLVLKKSALMISGACILIFLIFPPLFFFDGRIIGSGLYKWGLVLALLGTVIPPAFFSYGMPKTGISLGAILSAAELPVAVVSSCLILQEEVKPLQWLGVAIILLAIISTNIRFNSSKKQTADSID